MSDQKPPDGRDPSQPRGASEGWAFLSYMIGGMALYGFVGWLIGRWTGLPVLFPVGMLVGLASAIALIIFRVTRS
jgi:ATP synthase protein I